MSKIKNLSILVETEITDVDNFITSKIIWDFPTFLGLDMTGNIGWAMQKSKISYPSSFVIAKNLDFFVSPYLEIFGELNN